MSDTAEAGRIPLMAPDKAQDITHGLTWLARSYEEALTPGHGSGARLDTKAG